MQMLQCPLPLLARLAHHNVIALNARTHAAPRQGARHLPGATAAAGARVPRPLRLMVNRQSDGSCRIVISGRMADVCAELNRMAG